MNYQSFCLYLQSSALQAGTRSVDQISNSETELPLPPNAGTKGMYNHHPTHLLVFLDKVSPYNSGWLDSISQVLELKMYDKTHSFLTYIYEFLLEMGTMLTITSTNMSDMPP